MIEALASLSAFDKAAFSRTSAAGPVTGLAGATSAAQAAPAVDFGSVLAQVATDVRSSLRAGEASAIAGIQGRAGVQQVVEAVMSAEQSLQTAVAIRDKVVSAYLELSRMQI